MACARALSRLVALGVATLGAAAFVPSATATAATSMRHRAGIPTMTAVAGVRGFFDPGDHVVVDAEITSADTIDATVDVVMANINTSILRNVQIAGGTTKRVQLVVPTTFDQGDIDVHLSIDGRVVVTTTVRMTPADTVEIVGIMPALASRLGKVPEQVQLPTDLGRAQLQAIPDDHFALGPTALDVYDTIVGVGGDLKTLDANGLGSLLSWLNHGGRLVLDDASGVDALPQQWRPGIAKYTWAGRGEVRIVDGLAAAGKFTAFIDPSTSSSNEQPSGIFGATDSGSRMQDDLAARAGVKLPSLTPILIGLFVYVVIIGPLLYIGLRLWRRLALGWVLVPLLSLATAGVVLMAGRNFRDSGRPAAVAFADGFPGGSEEQVALLTFTRSGGTSRVAFPQTWQLSTSQQDFSNFDVAHQFVAAAEHGTFQARLEPGQVTDADFIGLSGEVGLRIEATATDTTINGTVTNSTTATLVDVAVFSAGDSQLIGTLAAGETKPFQMDAKPVFQNFGLSQNVWARPDQNLGFGKPSEKAEFAIWSLASERVALYPTGIVRVAGWTDDRPSVANLGSDVRIRSVISSTAPVQAGAGVLSAGAVRTVQVRAPFTQFGGGSGESAIRYLLPSSMPDQQLVVERAVGMTSLDFWTGTTWQKVLVRNGVAPVPKAAIRGGVVLVRIVPDVNFSFDSSAVLPLRGATPEDLS